MNELREDWNKLESALNLLEDGPIDYLDDNNSNTLYYMLEIIRNDIKDQLSVKELSAYTRNKRCK